MVPAIGYMTMPADFPYADVFLRGRPRHGLAGRLQTYDAFYRKHPPMSTVQRAKLFAPFDALRGFQEAIAGKRARYEDRRILTEGEKEELDRRIGILHSLTLNSRMARENCVSARITYYVPCQDPDHDAYQKQGRYESVTGTVKKIDPVSNAILLDDQWIHSDDICQIESDLFPDSDSTGC